MFLELGVFQRPILKKGLRMDKISLIIPHLALNEHKKELLQKLLDSMEGQYDELILMTDKTDCLSKEINKGMAKATGDYLIISNDDLTLFKGTLRDLCDSENVTVPKVIGGLDKLFHGHMWCMPRSIYQDVGPQWEGYDGFYYDDSDYWMKIEAKGYKIVKREDVVILHPNPATTLSQLPKGGREETNRSRFVERWGKDALRRIT